MPDQRVPRIYLPNVVYEITCRAFQARFLLRPSAEVNDLIAGAIGRAQELYPAVRLHGVSFLSNHATWLVSSPKPTAISQFMGFINGRISSELGKLHDWPGKLWERPMKPIPVVDQDGLLARFDYLLAQGVKEGLVEQAEDWPGVSCVAPLLGTRPLVGTWYERDLERRMKQRKREVPAEQWQRRYEVVFSPLPGFEHLSRSEYAAFVAERLAGIEGRARAERQHDGRGCVGTTNILSRHPHHRPSEPATSPAPSCHAASNTARKAFYRLRERLVAWYRDAARQLASGVTDVLFPPGSFPPRFPHTAAVGAVPVLSDGLSSS